MYRMRLIAALAVVSASCGDTTAVAPSLLNFDRPTDIAFACYGGLRITEGLAPTAAQPVEPSAQPVDACEIRSGPDLDDQGTRPVPAGQEELTSDDPANIPAPIGAVNWYGFVLQSAPGTVVVIQIPTQTPAKFLNNGPTLKDSDELTPGNNAISVGEDPVAIATDKAGCYEVTANAGSCDLSTLEVSSAIKGAPDVRVDRMTVTNAAGQEMLARPAAMVSEPGAGTIGTRCPATPTGLVWIAYPGCHLVAAVDVSNGQIVKGIDFSSGAPVVTDGNVSCPAECGGGGSVTAGIRPVTLNLVRDKRVDTTKLVIGADNSSSITVAELGADSLPQSVRQVSFEDPTGTLGFTSVALTPQIGMGGQTSILDDEFNSNQFQFVYGVATDRSVRVADVLSLNRECDAQVDPRLINDVQSVQQLACFKVGDPATPRRRPGARTPGIELFRDEVPTSVAVFTAPTSKDADTLVGHFGVITASDGRSFVFNTDDDAYADFRGPPSKTALPALMPLAIAHQLRDSLPGRDITNTVAKRNDQGEEIPNMFVTTCAGNGPNPDSQTNEANGGGPRAAAPPTRSVPSGTFAAEKVTELPTLRQLTCTGDDTTTAVSELSFNAPPDVRDLVFPDLRTLVNETWTLTWEGPLSKDTNTSDIDGPPVRVGQMEVDNQGFRIVDASKPYCDAGVEQYDILQMTGCDPAVGDAECPVGYSCFVHPNSQIAGLGACMLTTEADRLADACKDFLTSLRRYTVNRTESGLLTLLPRKHVLSTTPVDGCTDDDQCQALADLAQQNLSASQPQDATATDARSYACMVDTDRAPLNGPGQTGKRCVETCTETSDCGAGLICQAGACMEGVEPPQACVNGPQRFELHAGEAFTLIGTQSGYRHPLILDTTTGKCVKDPAASPLDVGRVKLTPPACDPAADPRTGLKPDGTYDANPCSLTVAHTELEPNYIAGSCTLNDPATQLVERQAPAVRVHTRGPTLTLVDPYYPGDLSCIGDRAGNLGKIPLEFSGYQLSWHQTGGFSPMALPITPSFPVKAVRGPTESIWVIDEGDIISTSITTVSTRGALYRISSQTPEAAPNILQ